MRTLYFIPMFLIAAACCLYVHAAEKVATFSSLPATDTLEVRFTSSGCFHFYTFDFLFHRGAASSVTVVSVTQQWSVKKKKYIDKSREKLGNVQLTDADLKGLDELLNFYRSQPGGGCTTVDHITVSQLRDGKAVATEQFVDGSCATHRTNSFTTLPEIAQRLERKE